MDSTAHFLRIPNISDDHLKPTAAASHSLEPFEIVFDAGSSEIVVDADACFAFGKQMMRQVGANESSSPEDHRCPASHVHASSLPILKAQRPSVPPSSLRRDPRLVGDATIRRALRCLAGTD